MNYIGGHNPDLVCHDADGVEVVERVDLTEFKTEAAVLELLEAKGLVRTPKDEV